MAWWAWLIFGFLLMAAEMLSAGLFLLFFGVGAIIVGTLTRFGLAGPLWMEWLLFSVISLVSLALFRKPLAKRLKLNERKEVDTMIGEAATASENIAVGAQGQVTMRGSTWKARNIGTQDIQNGATCRVGHVDGIVLEVKNDSKL